MTARRARGLTLLEILVAASLLGVFFVGVYGLVAGTLRLRERIEEETLPYATGPVVLQRIAEDLANAVIGDLKDLDGFRAESESAGGTTSTRIDFVTTVDSRARVRVREEWVKYGVNEVGYRARRSETGEGIAIYRREDPGVDDDPLEGGKYYKLVDGVREFRIDFFSEDPGAPESQEAEGETDWDAKEQQALPWGCRITLVLLPHAEVDSAGDVVSEGEERKFVAYVAFRSRFDKPEDQNPAQNPPGSPR